MIGRNKNKAIEVVENMLKDGEAVNHPAHYNQGVETIDYIESHGMNFNEGNVVKYVTRHRHKNGLEDLLKAQFYLQREIERYKANASN